MNHTREVTVIPAKIVRTSFSPTDTIAKKRVAAYARVSTDTEEQLTSYEAQVDYYTKHIQSNPAWQFAGVYTDEGISATSTKHREGFNRMVQDALDDKIDLIITKSVSRFARNTVDTLTTVRRLKEKRVEVFFEKENIYTLEAKGELLITIMSSLAQEESRSISENVSWGQRKRFADGKVCMPYGQFLGYRKGADGLPEIVETEAKTVRLIYRMFLDGKTHNAIARHLTEKCLPTPSGKTVWRAQTVLSILQNEKYKGDAILQKRFTVDFLTKKTKRNEGEVPQYYVEGSHPAIIEPEVFELVQAEMNRRKETGRKPSGLSCFSGKILCGDCGGTYGSKVWYSNSKYRRTIWRCNRKYEGDARCTTPHLQAGNLKQTFVKAFNQLAGNKLELIAAYDAVLEVLTDTTGLDRRTAQQQSEYDIIIGLLNRCVEDNTRMAQDQEAYRQQYAALAERFEAAKQRLAELAEGKRERLAKREQITQFMKELEQREGLLVAFDEALWNATVDFVTIFASGEAVFAFKDGSEVRQPIC